MDVGVALFSGEASGCDVCKNAFFLLVVRNDRSVLLEEIEGNIVLDREGTRGQGRDAFVGLCATINKCRLHPPGDQEVRNPNGAENPD
jgi:hypothetical protein